MSQNNQPKSKETGTAKDESEQLKAMQAKLEELQAKLDEKERADGTRYAPASKPFVGDHGGYDFKVTTTHNHPERFSHIPEEEVIRASDETEAKRVFMEKYETKKGSGRPLHHDSRGIRVDVVCVDPRRGERVRLQQMISRLRRKVDSGQTLTAEEEKLASQYEDQVYSL